MVSVFPVCQIIEKHREYNHPTYIAFIDYEKASDKVNRVKLWDILRKYGISQHLIGAIQSLYIDNNIKIRSSKSTSQNVRSVYQRVTQGSPALFNVYINDDIKTWQNNILYHHVIHDRILDTLLFAYDHMVLADSEDNLQRAIWSLHNVIKTYNLKISTNKTKIMTFPGKDHLRAKIIVDNQVLEQKTPLATWAVMFPTPNPFIEK